MSYTVYLFRKEVKELYSDLEFLENEALITPFTNEQFEKLKSRLLNYGYQIEKSDENLFTFNFKGWQDNITVF